MNAQPLGFARLRRSHPFTNRLVFCGLWMNGAYVDLVSGQRAVALGGVVDVVKVRPFSGSKGAGTVIGPRGTTAGYLEFKNQTGLDRLNTVGTILAVGYHTGTVAFKYHAVIETNEAVTANYGATLLIDDGNQISTEGPIGFIVGSSGTNNNAAFGPTGNVFTSAAEDVGHAFGMGWDGSSHFIYYNSTSLSTTAGTSTPNANSNRRTRVNTYKTVVPSSSTGGNAICCAWERNLSLQEYRAWAANPWDMLEPANDIDEFVFPAAAAGGFFSRVIYDTHIGGMHV